MFCHKCGEEIQPDDTKFCPSCGTSISNSAAKPTEYSSNQNVTIDESDSPKPDRSLSDDVRQKYLSELKDYKESWIVWVVWPVVIVSFVISEHELGTGWWNWVIAYFVLGTAFSLLEVLVGAERKLKNHSDDMLELLYSEMERKKSFKKIATIVVIIGIGILLFLKYDIWSRITTDAKCSVVLANVNEDSFLISGEPDYGFSVFTMLKNSGKDGNVFVNVSLSSSEGELERKQTVFLKAGETQSLNYQFAEPTVNATNVKYSVTCKPSSKPSDNSE